jgi:hypothetical protein
MDIFECVAPTLKRKHTYMDAPDILIVYRGMSNRSAIASGSFHVLKLN